MTQGARPGRTKKKARTVALIAAVAAVAGLTGACGGGESSEDAAGDAARPAGGSDTAAVTVKLFMFDPSPLQIKAGTKVTWTNQDEILHTVTAGTRTYDGEGLTKDITPSGEFDLPLDGKGSTADFTFTETGTVTYLCKIHPGMDTEVVVS